MTMTRFKEIITSEGGSVGQEAPRIYASRVPRKVAVRYNSVQLAKKLGLSENTIQMMKRAGLRFDFGLRTTLATVENWMAAHPDFRASDWRGSGHALRLRQKSSTTEASNDPSPRLPSDGKSGERRSRNG